MHDTAQGFLTRMTAREQGRTTVLERPVERPALSTVPTWEEFHRTVDQRMMEGTRAIEKIAAEAVHAGYELDIYPDPRLLSAGGQKTHAGRLDPLTEKCDNARVAGLGRSITGQSEAAAPRRDEFHTILTNFYSPSQTSPLSRLFD